MRAFEPAAYISLQKKSCFVFSFLFTFSLRNFTNCLCAVLFICLHLGLLGLLLFPQELMAEVSKSQLVSKKNDNLKKKIGVITYSSEKRYEEALRGFKDSLNQKAWNDSKVEYFIRDGERNKALLEDMIKEIKWKKLDLIFSIGTIATLAITREIEDTPIVFSIVFDPVFTKIVNNWYRSGNNTTGTSCYVPMAMIFDILTEFSNIKKVAVLYSPEEKNSEKQIKDIKKWEANQQKIKVVSVPMSTDQDMISALPLVIANHEAIYLTGSTLNNKYAEKIAESATEKKVITIAHLDDLVGKGILFGVTSNSYQLGFLAGEKAVKILKGGAPSLIPIDFQKDLEFVLNSETLKKGAFLIPDKIMKKITKKIQ